MVLGVKWVVDGFEGCLVGGETDVEDGDREEEEEGGGEGEDVGGVPVKKLGMITQSCITLFFPWELNMVTFV